MGELSHDPFLAARLILTLRREGITDPDVLRAVEAVPRSAFIEPELADLAYEDCVLPIGCGQTLESPSVVASMILALDLKACPEANVLLVGVGSGYMAALIQRLAGTVWGVERFRRLADRSRVNLSGIGADPIHVLHGDGLKGWPEHGPYDRILLTGAVDTVPGELFEQLSESGLCISPLEEPRGHVLAVFDRSAERVSAQPTVQHTPLRSGVSKVL
ncbi:MAG: protein-L-isoaspartate(D-aspartate) O-methyltransferase [Pseudomonadota bacterium]